MPPFLNRENAMGLFSNKKKTEVTTTVVRVIADEMIPDVGERVVNRIIVTEEPMLDVYKESLIDNVSLKADRMYKWAKDNYHYRTPRSTIVSNTSGEGVVKQVIEDIENASITLEYFEYAPANSLHMAWENLVKNFGYDPSTNKLNNLSIELNQEVYLKDIVTIYTSETFADADPGTLAQWGPAATAGYSPDRLAQLSNSLGDLRKQSNYIVDTDVLSDYVEATYIYEDENKILHTGKFTVPMTGYNVYEEYYHVKYKVTKNGVTTTKYWSYENGSGGYSSIDAIFLTKFDEIGSFLPNIYFKLNGEPLAVPEQIWYAPYKSSKKVCTFLGFDYAKIGESVLNQVKDEAYEQAYMTMGVPFKTQNQVEMLYLFQFFSLLYYNTPSGSGVSGYSDFTPRRGQSIVIADKGFTTTLSHQGIAKRKVMGRIGKKGFCSSGNRTIDGVSGYIRRSGGVSSAVTKVTFTDCRFFRYQVNDLYYEEIAVYGASFRYHVYGKYHVVATGESSKFLVPIDYAISSVIPINRREELYSRSFHNVFNTVVVTESKWYQSSVFKAILIVIAVAIIIFSAGGLSGISASIMAFIAQGATLIALAAVKYVAFSLLVRYGAQLIVEELGAKLGIVGAILITAVGVYLTQDASAGLEVWADSLIAVGNGLMTAATDSIANLAAGLNGQLADFMLIVDEQQKALVEAQKLMGGNVNINPFDFIGKTPMFVDGETPDDYFNRTVHSGNIGVLSIDLQTDYVKNALSLPSFSDTKNMTNIEDDGYA